MRTPSWSATCHPRFGISEVPPNLGTSPRKIDQNWLIISKIDCDLVLPCVEGRFESEIRFTFVDRYISLSPAMLGTNRLGPTLFPRGAIKEAHYQKQICTFFRKPNSKYFWAVREGCANGSSFRDTRFTELWRLKLPESQAHWGNNSDPHFQSKLFIPTLCQWDQWGQVSVSSNAIWEMAGLQLER